MKKEWENAEMDVILLEEKDIIITSPPLDESRDPGEIGVED